MSDHQTKARRWLPYLLIAVATAIVWGQSITFQFVWDDKFFIQDLKSIRSLKNVPEMFTSAEASAPRTFMIFRPLRTLHYAVLFALSGGDAPDPRWFHLTNLIWHAGTAILLFHVCLTLFQRNENRDAARWLALVIALGFAVHPATSEVVCWAKSLDDLMATFFTLCSTYFILKWTGDRRNYWFALVFFLLAVYSKESAVPFALITFFMFWKLHARTAKQSAILASAFFLVAAVHVVHRHLLLGQSSQTTPLSGSHAQTLIDMFQTVVIYLRLSLGLPPFFIDYSFLPLNHPFFSGAILTGVALFLCFIGLTLMTLSRARTVSIGLGLLWMLVLFLPVSNLVPMMQFMAERFLYLPLVGGMTALGGCISLLPRPKAGVAVLFAVTIFWAIVAWDRSFIWKDPLTLFVQTTQQGKKMPRMENAAVYAILDQPHMQESYTTNANGKVVLSNADTIIHTVEQGLKVYPRNEFLLSRAGLIYAQTGDPARAATFFEQAAVSNPKNANNWINLAQVYAANRQFDKARETLKRVPTSATNDLSLAKRIQALEERLAKEQKND